MKEACFLLVDVSASVSTETLANVRRALNAFTMKTFIQGGQNEYGLLLFGDDVTSNQLHESMGEYEHVNVKIPLARPDFAFIKQIDKISTSNSQEGDPIDAIIVGVNEVVTRVKKLKFTKRLYVFTSACGPACDPEQIQDLATIIKDNEIVVNIIILDGFSPNRDVNIASLRQLANLTETSILSADIGLHLLMQQGSKSVRPTAKFRGVLEITSIIKFPASSFGKTMAAGLPSLKKQSADSPGSEVKLSRASFNKVTGQEISPDMRLKAYRYGNALIPISDIDETLFACRDNKALKLLGFSSRSSIPRHLYMSGVDCVVPSSYDPNVRSAFSAFIVAMNELDLVALARYSKKDCSPPRPILLSPGLEGEAEVLYLNFLPFADDIREYQFESLSRYVLTEAMVHSIDELIQGLDLSTAAVDPISSDPIPALSPESTFNPLLQRFYQTLHARLLDKNASVADIPHESRAALEPNSDMFKKMKPLFNKFKDQFPLVKAPETIKGRSRMRRDWRSEISRALSEQGLSMTAEDASLAIPNILAQQVTQVSTANPAADYQVLVKDHERATEATRELFDVILKLVNESFQGSGESKALDCIEVSRELCKDMGFAHLFNEGMGRVREKLRETTFWDVMRMKNIMPISSDESSSSNLTTAQASSFYEEPVSTQSEQPEENTASIWEEAGWDEI